MRHAVAAAQDDERISVNTAGKAPRVVVDLVVLDDGFLLRFEIVDAGADLGLALWALARVDAGAGDLVDLVLDEREHGIRKQRGGDAGGAGRERSNRRLRAGRPPDLELALLGEQHRAPGLGELGDVSA